jgi:tetratricopeptide (TPR) repeat protein
MIRRPVLISVLLVLLTFVFYSPALKNEFVNYDDPEYVTANPHAQSGLSWDNIVWAFTSGHASNWHPLTWLSHMLDCQLFGQRAAWHHLVNVIFHAANSVMLFLLLRRMTGTHWRSAGAAALFAWHPLHVESVAWVSERKDVLSTCFFLLTLMAYVRYTSVGNEVRRLTSAKVRRGSEPPHVGSYNVKNARAPTFLRESPAFWYVLALLLFALGLMSKPMLVTTPFLLLLLDFWPLKRLEPFTLKAFSRLMMEKIPFLLLSAVSCVVTFIVQREGGAVSVALTFGARVANALVSYVRYLGKFFWPDNLAVLYPHPGHWPAAQVTASAVVLVAVCCAVIWSWRLRPFLLVGWLWFLGTLVPVIGLVQVGVQSMADRYSYIPLIGLAIMVVWGLAEAIPKATWRVPALGVSAGVALLAFSCLTVRQVEFWKTSESLFGHTVQVTQGNYLAYNNLGYYLANRGHIAEAMENYQKALAINPSYEDALNNMGYALAGQKRNAEAIPYYERALRVRPNHVEVNNNLGNALSEIGRLDEAIQHYRIALKEKPDHADAHNNLGIALAMQGKLDEAIPHFRDAIRFKPDYASAHSNLGNALAAQHNLAEATQEYFRSLELNPKDAQAHNNLGNVLAEQGKLDQAVNHYEQAIKLNSDNPEAHFNLGMALLRQGKRDEAIAHYREALRLRPEYPEAQRQLEALGALR